MKLVLLSTNYQLVKIHAKKVGPRWAESNSKAATFQGSILRWQCRSVQISFSRSLHQTICSTILILFECDPNPNFKFGHREAGRQHKIKTIGFCMEMMMVSDLRLSLAEFLFSSSFWPPQQGSHSDEQHPTVLKICTCNNGPSRCRPAPHSLAYWQKTAKY